MNEEQIFHEALAKSPSERLEYLNEACKGNQPLCTAVEALLRASEGSTGFLEQPAISCDDTLTQGYATAHEGPGIVISPYKLIEQIGEGGMGTVWMAQQTEPVKRLVALKLIKAGMDSKQVLARFDAERQALALMDHPNIAKVYDAGTTGSGHPYFIMELVKGQSITKYCDEHHLTPRQRLELFVPVCQAIQHAHQKGIIHRDLKPSNVLIALYDGKPVPKVIDFGVAKATGQSLTDKTLVTGFGNIVGTLEYMSPEQAEINQLDIDTRSDIYSLGVLLYELLTGSTPFSIDDLQKVGMLEMLRVIREQEPSKPSTKLSTAEGLSALAADRGTEPAKLTKLVRGELDWIVMKALEKDRNRRYETANGFAMDVDRYLMDQPVQACPPSAWYRWRKFVARNREAVLAVSFVLFALIAGVLVTTWQAFVADQQRLIAEVHAQKALAAAEAEKKAKETAELRETETNAVLEFVEKKIFSAPRPKEEEGGMGYDVRLADALTKALPFVENSFKDQPLIEARLRMTLGISFLYLGKASIAADQFLTARSIYSKHRGPDHCDTLRSMHSLANSYEDLGRHDEALKLREETLVLRKSKLGLDHIDTLGSMMNLANSYEGMRRHTDAMKLRKETLELQKAQLGPEHLDTLMSMQNLANSYSALGRHTDALKLREESLALLKAKLGSEHLDTLPAMTNLSNSYNKSGRHADALRLDEEVLAVQKAKLGTEHPDTLKSMHNLAYCYGRVGRHADALKLRQETLTLRIALLSDNHPDTLISMWGVAESLVNLDRAAEAIPIIDELVQRASGQDVHPRLLWSVLINIRFRHYQKTKDPAGCRKTAEMWEILKRTDADSLYAAARMRAVTTELLVAGNKSKNAAKEVAAEADLAMDWLKKTVAAGYKDAAHMNQDPDLAALHEREDFKKLIVDLEASIKKK